MGFYLSALLYPWLYPNSPEFGSSAAAKIPNSGEFGRKLRCRINIVEQSASHEWAAGLSTFC
jgi:hypothetical protein